MRISTRVRSFVIAIPICLIPPISAGAQGIVSDKPSPEVRRFIKRDASQSEVQLLHVRVVDGTGGPVLQDQTLTIRKGKIADLRPTKASEQQNGPRVLDLSGRTVSPGFGWHA